MFDNGSLFRCGRSIFEDSTEECDEGCMNIPYFCRLGIPTHMKQYVESMSSLEIKRAVVVVTTTAFSGWRLLECSGRKCTIVLVNEISQVIMLFSFILKN